MRCGWRPQIRACWRTRWCDGLTNRDSRLSAGGRRCRRRRRPRADPRLDDDPRDPPDVSRRACREADVEHLLAVRPLRRRRPRAADDGGAAPWPRPEGGARRRSAPSRTVARTRRRWRSPPSGGRARSQPGTFAAWQDLTPRPRSRPGSAGACCGSRTMRCSAARGGSSTISRPCARTFHAAVVRSQLAHARIEVDATAALALPGVVGVLTGADVARLSRPFPAGIESGVPQYAAAIDTVRYVGEPIAVVVARDRYLAEDAAELVEVDYDPLDAGARPGGGSSRRACTTAASRTATSTARWPGPSSSCARPSAFPRFTCTPVECYAVVADWDATAGRLTAWANFQGPFTLHGVAAAALGLQGRPAAAADAARLGWLVRDQVVRLRVRRADGARRPAPRRPRGLDRGPARAPRGERRRDRPHDGGRGRVHRRRAAARAPLRRDRGRRRVRPGTRAGDALPHARLALGRVHRAERRRPEPRRAHEHDPLGSQPRLRRPAALPRARADDGDRRPTPRPRSRRARAAQPDPGRCDAVPHALGRALRLRRLRGLPRQGARAGRLRRARRTGRRAPSRRSASPGSGSRASSSRRSRTWGTSRSRRPPTSARRRCPSPATPREPRSRSIRSAGSRCGSLRHRRARATARSAPRSSPTCSAALPTPSP